MQKKTLFFQQITPTTAQKLNAGISWASLAVIVAPGSGYAVNDVLTVSGGTALWPIQIEVTQVDLNGLLTGAVGGIVAFRFKLSGNQDYQGAYTSKPTNPVSHSGGTGTGATFTLTWIDNDLPPAVKYIDLTVDTQDVRYRGDGTAPTASVASCSRSWSPVPTFFDGPHPDQSEQLHPSRKRHRSQRLLQLQLTLLMDCFDDRRYFAVCHGPSAA